MNQKKLSKKRTASIVLYALGADDRGYNLVSDISGPLNTDQGSRMKKNQLNSAEDALGSGKPGFASGPASLPWTRDS